MTDATPPADANNAAPTENGAPAGPGFRILAQYVKDMSFENPKAPDSLRVEGKPAIDLGVEMNAQGRKDGLFEVELRLTVKASTDAMTVFNIELLYGGLFALSGVAEQDIEPMLLIECPRYLFPFAREIISAPRPTAASTRPSCSTRSTSPASTCRASSRSPAVRPRRPRRRPQAASSAAGSTRP